MVARRHQVTLFKLCRPIPEPHHQLSSALLSLHYSHFLTTGCNSLPLVTLLEQASSCRCGCLSRCEVLCYPLQKKAKWHASRRARQKRGLPPLLPLVPL